MRSAPAAGAELEANRLPTEFVTDEHDATFAAAGLRPGYGTRIDSLLKGISHLAAARLLKALKDFSKILI